jgi:hypothetical protein
MLRVHGFFQPLEVDNLGAMVSIMSILTTKSAREFCPEIVVVLPWLFVVVVPLGFWLPPVGWFCWGLFPPGPGLLLFWFFSFLLGIIRLMD